ncbi:class C sortase [uncultured Ruminococcus sp.]|uniref:class C sortase n=1 Tax=uncultured Ruminococcus sp. TaxID=165186 RepID=UPI000ECEA5C8|nr:class C sortase [uncultured Ruminococcus sp.]HCJ40469.1 class C sortase [Ruminococcus sp.]
MSRKKNTITNVLLVFMLLVGLSVMLYPTVSDWWNKNMTSRAISVYKEAVTNTDDDAIFEMLAKADEYNRQLAVLRAPFTEYEKIGGYDEILDLTGTGIMGYITVPAMNVELPIYHGTSEGVLNIASGHLKGSSFPVGGADTHAVISAHRGLPSARLFTDLDKLVVGDYFTISVLDQVYTYEVEEINIVLPTQVEPLHIQPDRDLVTLMTCTPYGINTHRLLVRAHRIATMYEAQSVRVPADCIQVDPLLVVPAIALPLMVILLVFWFRGGKKTVGFDELGVSYKYRY